MKLMNSRDPMSGKNSDEISNFGQTSSMNNTTAISDC